ncbi:probable hexosyltransferase MUCI70 [Rutidosis leptorrhynchoides]|uniref:probable hexosyltransferase MUCI70 n=1 Tax=Rutidosis leptorrhynchoides TaxID=125765 RepID=UPI003A99A69E
MTGGGSLSVALRTPSYGSLQQLHNNIVINSNIGLAKSPFLSKRPSSKMLIPNPRDKEKGLPIFCCRLLGRARISMLLLFLLAFVIFTLGSLLVTKEQERSAILPPLDQSSLIQIAMNLSDHPCKYFAFPPPPPPENRRPGPRPCPVCYISPEQAIASMPAFPSESSVLRQLTYAYDENPQRNEPHAGSDFGGYPTLKQRSDSYDIKESMTVHCGFVNGSKPGNQTGFDIDDADLLELEQPRDIIVASAIFGNYDLIQQPENISEIAKKNVHFYMFIDETTEAYLKNSSVLDDTKRVGLWRIIVVRNVPYNDPRRNGKIPKLLLHRIFPNIRYSIWIDGKLKLVVDPYQILERFLWRENANFAISRHYKRFSMFDEAIANKAAGKYDNSSIDAQIDFYINEGLTPYSEAKLPITSDVPEGCVLIKEHTPITNLFTCLWFNEVDRFTSRDQLSFSTVRDKIMAKVNWNINMFLDCERRNFVIQAYHKDLLDHMPTPVAPRTRELPPALTVLRNSGKRGSLRHRRERRRSRRHRKVSAGSNDNNSI